MITPQRAQERTREAIKKLDKVNGKLAKLKLELSILELEKAYWTEVKDKFGQIK